MFGHSLTVPVPSDAIAASMVAGMTMAASRSKADSAKVTFPPHHRLPRRGLQGKGELCRSGHEVLLGRRDRVGPGTSGNHTRGIWPDLATGAFPFCLSCVRRVSDVPPCRRFGQFTLCPGDGMHIGTRVSLQCSAPKGMKGQWLSKHRGCYSAENDMKMGQKHGFCMD
jgi:hypothetical protein